MADMPAGERDSETSERRAHAEATYERLFGPRDGRYQECLLRSLNTQRRRSRT
jgi:hypothetical protein